jgi:hypothetical protein
MPFTIKNMLLKCKLVAKFVIELGFIITLDLIMKPVADSLPLEPAIKLIQNVAVSPNSGSNYVVCVINKELSEHSW